MRFQCGGECGNEIGCITAGTPHCQRGGEPTRVIGVLGYLVQDGLGGACFAINAAEPVGGVEGMGGANAGKGIVIAIAEGQAAAKVPADAAEIKGPRVMRTILCAIGLRTSNWGSMVRQCC